MRFRCSRSEPRTRQETSAGRSSRRWRRRIARAAVLAASLLAALTVAAFSFELALPGVSDAQSKVAAIVRAHHGALLRLPLSAKLAKAIVAVEDQHFYTNVFVNVLSGASRAAVASLERSGDPGGSTIAQQLAKQLYPQPPGLGTTLQDLALGVKLSFEYSKSEILDMYLNAIYYGNGYWGASQAARGYFGVSPDRLDWAEAAMLAGLPQAPSAYNPLEHYTLAKQRQEHVLDQLVATDVLTRRRADAAYRALLPLRRTSNPAR